MKSKNNELGLLLSLGLDYVRWTQLAPMLLAWTFALFLLVVFVFINFEQQAVSALDYVLLWLSQLPVLGDYFIALFNSEGKGEGLDLDDLKSSVLTGWFIVSLVFMLVNMVLSSLFGPFQPWTLKRKLVYAGFGSMLFFTALVGMQLTSSENYNGSIKGWLFNYSAWSLLLYLVSVYCLTIAHILGLISQALSASPGEPGTR